MGYIMKTAEEIKLQIIHVDQEIQKWKKLAKDEKEREDFDQDCLNHSVDMICVLSGFTTALRWMLNENG